MTVFVNSGSVQKDITFLEKEFLTFLLMKFFLGKNFFEVNGISGNFEPVESIQIGDENRSEYVVINSNNISECKELINGLKNSKKVMQLSLRLTTSSTQMILNLKTSPLRISSLKAPKSIAEDLSDRIVERILYLKVAYDFFDKELLNFAKIRCKEEWLDLVRDFRAFLEGNN